MAMLIGNKKIITLFLTYFIGNSILQCTIPTPLEKFLSFVTGQQGIEYVTMNHMELTLMHDAFLDHLTPQEMPMFIAIGGSVGAGKTTYRKKIMDKNMCLCSADEVMSKLPSYQQNMKIFDAETAFQMASPTASLLAHIILQFAIKSKYSIIYDRTCSEEKHLKALAEVKEQGYRIKFVGLYVEEKIAMQRVLAREKIEGRSIPETVLRKSRKGFCTLWPDYLKLANEAVLYNANQEALSIIFSSTIGVIDADCYQNFLNNV